VAAVLGLLIGLVSLRLKGVYFAMFTLAIAEMFFIYFSRLPTTQAEDGFAITALPTWLDARQSRLSFYYITLALFILTFVFVRRLIHSPTGAVFLAIRENEERARAIGFDTLRFKLTAIMISGVIASVAGMLQVLLNKKVGPELLSLDYTVDPLLHTIIGGIGTFTGPIIGAAGLHLSDTLLRDAEVTLAGRVINIGDSWALILGIVFIVVVLVFPQGVVGTWNRWRLRRRAPQTEAGVPPR
jgi:branched-chain amino acid transport system permease protein